MSSERRDLRDDPQAVDGYQYDDPEELYQAERIKHILAARKRFREGRLRARSRMYERQSGVSESTYRDIAAQLALDYVMELEPLIRRADSDLLDREIQIQAREIRTEDGPVTLDTQTVTVSELLDSGGTVTSSYKTEYHDTRTNSTKSRQDTAHVTISAEASQRLVRLADDFLEDIMPSGLHEQQEDEWELWADK